MWMIIFDLDCTYSLTVTRVTTLNPTGAILQSLSPHPHLKITPYKTTQALQFSVWMKNISCQFVKLRDRR